MASVSISRYFSLGVSFYQLLTGTNPYPPPDDPQFEGKIKNKEFACGRSWRALSKDYKTMIKEMLNPDPNARPTAFDLLGNTFYTKSELEMDTQAQMLISHSLAQADDDFSNLN